MHICISTQCIFYSKFMCATHIFSVALLATLQSNSSHLMFLSRFNHLWWHARAAHLPIVSFHTHMHAHTYQWHMFKITKYVYTHAVYLMIEEKTQKSGERFLSLFLSHSIQQSQFVLDGVFRWGGKERQMKQS